MKKNFITVNWSAAETEPWTSKLEIIKIGFSCIICKCNDTRLHFESDGNIYIPIKKSKFEENYDGSFHYKLTNCLVKEIYAWVEYSEIENLIKENNWKIGEYDFSPVIIDEVFTDENMTVKEAYFKSKVVGRYIKRFENDLDGMEAANMTLKEAKDQLKAENDDIFYGTDSVCRWMIYFILDYIVEF